MKTNSMNRKYSSILVLTVVLAVLFPLEGCAKELMTEEEPAGITMTTREPNVYFQIGIAGADNYRDLTIAWGDGEESKFTDAASSNSESGAFFFSHSYSGSSEHRIITITGENIERLDCRGSQLIALDVSRNRALKVLWCQHNPLTSLDVSKNIALEELEVGGGGNQITSIDVSKNTALRRLHIAGTQIKNLDVSKNHALTYLMCRYNQLTSTALNELFKTLTDKSVPFGPSPGRYIQITGNPGANDCDRSIAEKKEWTFREDLWKVW